MNRNRLAKLAADMRGQIGGSYGAAEKVIDGTHFALFRRDSRLELFVGRTDAAPDRDSAQVVAAAFGVAEDTHPKPCRVRLAAQDGRSVNVNCLSFRWTEL